MTLFELEGYRSGHNGADSKSDGRVIPTRGFDSHPFRTDFYLSFLF
jgi:hypothetical protein